MNYPTPLSPWFVVARVQTLDGGIEYYTTDDLNMTAPPKFLPKKVEAMLFMNLQTAKRVRDSDPDSFIMVLCSKEDLTGFGRG